MPRPAHKPTEQSRTLVRRLSGLGVVIDDIARLTEMHDDTLRKHYRADIDRGRAEANMAVSRSLFTAATRSNNPNVVAAMFWLKNRAGWKALATTDTSSLNGPTINVLKIEFVDPRDSSTSNDATHHHNGSGNGAARNGNGRVIDADERSFEISFTDEGDAS